MNQKLFNILLQPIEAIIASILPIIDQECHSQKLFFADFVRKLLFGYVEEVSSLRSLPASVADKREMPKVRTSLYSVFDLKRWLFPL